MDYQDPLAPLPEAPPSKKRLPLLPLFLALVLVITLVRVVFRNPWEDYRTVPYEKMEYLRPDTASLFAVADRLIQEAQKGEDYSAATEAYLELNRRYADYLSQSTLCYVRYCLDTTDPLYRQEQQFFDENGPLLEQKMDRLYYALAGTPFEDRLESDFFGEGFFDAYRGESHYNEALVTLLQKEESLIREYSALLANPTVSYQGKDFPYRELLSLVSPEEIPAVVDLFYQTYNPAAAQIYRELVTLRHEIAKAMGYASYAEYSYAERSRSFSPAQAKAYCQSVREQLLPLLLTLEESGTLDHYLGLYAMEEEELWMHFSAAVKQLGEKPEEAYDFLKTFSLCLLTDGENRAPGSYTTYLYNYDAPIIVAQQTHTSTDLVTVAHEFGHFLDFYLNAGDPTGVDVGECLSQSMELLLFSHLDRSMSREDAQYLEKARLLSVFTAIVEQAAYHEFELAVYSLPPQELTAQRLNELAEEYLPFTLSSYYGSEPNAPLCWFYVNHFFSAPFYTVSYSLSADVALQIYQQSQSANGMTPFLALATGEERHNLSLAATAAGLADPLSQERVLAIQSLFAQRFAPSPQ